MGQKVNPTGFRIGVIKDWDARWYEEKNYAQTLTEDLKIRQYIDSTLADASVANVEIERAATKVNISIHTGKPGMVIGKGGSEVDKLRRDLSEKTGKRVNINVVEIEDIENYAKLVGETIAQQLESRIAFRRAMKQAISRTMKGSAKGIKVQISGRLNGADMARTETLVEGTVPLHTLRADIDYAQVEAMTQYGKIGIKVWIYRGEILPVRSQEEE